MPNWCNNGITIRHKDPAMIERLFNARESGILQEFVPCPEELLDPRTSSFGGDDAEEKNQLREALGKKYGYSSWYDWQVANWGTKWDLCDVMVERVDANTVQGSFETAWAPPVNAYEKLCALGFVIEAYYYEPGMCFVGKVTGDEDSFDDEYYEYGGESSETVREAIGAELDDYFNISEDMAQYEEENEEN